MSENNEKIKSKCLKESFTISGEDEKKLTFYRSSKENEKIVQYTLREEGSFLIYAWLQFIPEEKRINFGVPWEYKNEGYGEAIYKNWQQILRELGIEKIDEYTLTCQGQIDHEFLQKMQTKDLLAKIEVEPSSQNAGEILGILKEYPYKIEFSEYNKIIKYALDSNIPIEELTAVINENGFNIKYMLSGSTPSFKQEDLEQFLLFGITGLKPTCMKHHFNRNFGFMELLQSPDKDDAAKEFRVTLEDAKKEGVKERKGNYRYKKDKKITPLQNMVLTIRGAGITCKKYYTRISKTYKKSSNRAI